MSEPRWRRYLRFFQRNPVADVDDELRFHFEQRVEQYRAGGMSHDDALAAARRQFGDVDAVRGSLVAIDTRIGRTRDAALWWDALRADLRTSIRSLRRQPGFSAAVIVTLALGLGVNAAMFSFLDRVYFRMPTGVADPQSLRRFWTREHNEKGEFRASLLSTGLVELAELRSAFGSDVDLALFARQPLIRFDNDGNDDNTIIRADAHYLPLLGVRPQIGRLFTTEEANPDAPAAVAVISDAFWRSRYGATTAVIGRPLVIKGFKYTIVGVAPRGFSGVDLERIDVWIPLGKIPIGMSGVMFAAGPPRYFGLLGRVRAGADENQLAARATTIYRRTNLGFQRTDLVAVVETGSIIEARGPGAQQREVMMASRLAGVAVIVLLIACANVVSLLMARAVARRREIAVRVALGISRRRLVWLLSVPAIVLSLVAGVAAALSAQATGAFLRTKLVPEIHFADPAIHWRVIAFTLGVSIIAGIVSTLPPSIQASKPDVTEFLKAGAHTGPAPRSVLRSGLVVVQAALSVTLLVAAGLFVRSVWAIEGIRVGLDVSEVMFARPSYDQLRAQFDTAAMARAVARLSHVAGVDGVALATGQPLGGMMLGAPYYTATDSSHDKQGTMAYARFNGVSDNYFEVTGTRILRGHSLLNAPSPSIIVTDMFAREYWPGQDAIGQCLRVGKKESSCFTVVGIAENAHRRRVIEDEVGHFFVPLSHMPFSGMAGYVMIIRSNPRLASSIGLTARRVIVEEFPGSRARIERLESTLGQQYRPYRIGMALFGAFGILALAVAVVGIYSSVSYAVAQRTHEFGVRIALGAGVRDVVDAVLRRALLPVAVGITLGVGLALAGGRFISSLLFGVLPSDPSVLIGVAVLLTATATLAALVPARRAARVDPVIALRAE